MRLTRSQLSIIPFLMIMDAAVISVSFVLAFHLRLFSFLTVFFPVTKGLPTWSHYLHALYFVVPLWLFIFNQYEFYEVYFLPSLDELIRILRAATMGIFFVVLGTFFYRDISYSRLIFLIFWLDSIILLFLTREVFKVVARFMLHSFGRRDLVLVIGRQNRMVKSILRRYHHYQTCYHPFDGEGAIEKIKNTIREKDVNQVLFVQLGWSKKKFLEFYDWCEYRNVDLKMVPDIMHMCRGEICIDSSMGLPVFHLRPISLSGFNFYFKRVIDLIVSIFVISLLWPFLLVVAVAIKLDSPGPVFYRHKRMGYRSRTFDFYKFRTMVTNADVLLEKFKSLSERKGPVFKMSNDPRITTIGKYLRRYSIDELPQLFNVLKGDMSLVGPRPQVLWEASAYDEWAKRRLRALPGITGLWQVSGRAALGYDEMIQLDIFYIENWSAGMDLKILFDTVPAVFSKKGAY